MTLKQLSSLLGWPEKWLWLIIQIESSWNPQGVNEDTGAAGLWQITPGTAKGLGLTTGEILMMSKEQQIGLGYKLLKPYAKKVKSFTEAYLAIIYPYAIGRAGSFVLGSEKSLKTAARIALQNPGIADGSKYITNSMVKIYAREKEAYYYGDNRTLIYAGVFSALAIIIYKRANN